MKNTVESKYKLSNHASQRLELRFGVKSHEAIEWVEQAMEVAVYVKEGHNGSHLYDIDGSRIIVGQDNTIITIHHKVSTQFLRPVFEREVRKLNRYYTKLLRQMELDKALSHVKYGELAVNKAMARNPNTQELIGERMEEVQAIIDGYEMRIERTEDEFRGKVKAIEMMSE